MFTTTFRLARDGGACKESYRKFAKHVGGVRMYGENKPIPLAEVAEVLGVDDALWSLGCTQQPVEADKFARLLAADFADHVLFLFENMYPNDDRPRKAVEAARLFAEGNLGDAARDAAGATAWHAARAAAGSAAWDAAWDAAVAAARAAAGGAAWSAARAVAWSAASAAARAAARAAAWDVAWSAAWDAAWDAEMKWQKERLMEMLSK